MKAALLVPALGEDIAKNKKIIGDAIAVAMSERPDLILLPETAPTGYQDRNEPEFDRTLCESVDGNYIRGLRDLARQHGTMISIGFFEKDGSHIYDASILIGKTGEILQHYRRVDSHWHDSSADPEVYRQGQEVLLANTEFGSFTTLICGDLYNDSVVRMTKALAPDYILFPLGRSLAKDEDPAIHLADAREQICILEATTLITNFLDAQALSDPTDQMIGGAAVVDAQGHVLAPISH